MYIQCFDDIRNPKLWFDWAMRPTVEVGDILEFEWRFDVESIWVWVVRDEVGSN